MLSSLCGHAALYRGHLQVEDYLLWVKWKSKTHWIVSKAHDDALIGKIEVARQQLQGDSCHGIHGWLLRPARSEMPYGIRSDQLENLAGICKIFQLSAATCNMAYQKVRVYKAPQESMHNRPHWLSWYRNFIFRHTHVSLLFLSTSKSNHEKQLVIKDDGHCWYCSSQF